MNQHAIVIAAKPPVPGKVKTRLSPPLSLNQSAQLYECFLIDTMNTVAAIKEIDRFIAFETHSSATQAFAAQFGRPLAPLSPWKPMMESLIENGIRIPTRDEIVQLRAALESIAKVAENKCETCAEDSRIAREALGILGYVCENCGKETNSMRKYCNDDCLAKDKAREALKGEK